MALIDVETGIMYCGDDEDIYRDILEMYIELVAESREVLSNALAEDRMSDYVLRVHAVKSNSRNVGAMTVGDLAEKAEKAARAGDRELVLEYHSDLLEMLEEAEKEAAGLLE